MVYMERRIERFKDVCPPTQRSAQRGFLMGFIVGVDRRQVSLLPPCVEDYPEALPFPASDVAIVKLDLDRLGQFRLA
jgi:hypothetical protein